MIPGEILRFTGDELDRFTREVCEGLDEAEPDHIQLEELEAENRRLYRGEPRTQRKDFPWKDAANLVIPIIGITVDSVVARVVNTIFTPQPFWTVSPLVKEMIETSDECEEFLEWSRKVEFPWYKELKSCCIETVQDGWSWMKMGWYRGTTRWFDGKTYRNIEINRPMPQWISIRDIIGQAGLVDPMQGEWIAHRTRITDTEFVNRMVDQYYKVSEKDAEAILDRKEDIAVDDGKISTKSLNTFYETWKWWRPKRFAKPVPVVATIHRPTRTLVRATHNPFYYGDWPLIRTSFVESKCTQGVGIASMLRMMQEELSTLHNQQVDNATLANTRFFVGRRNAVRKDTRVWPGRFLTINGDPDKDLKAFQLGDIYNSLQFIEQSVLAYAERRSGVSDYSLGRESSSIGDRTTATGTLAIIQEGNRRFDLNVRDLRDQIAVMGKMLLQMNQQFRQRDFAYYVQGPVRGGKTERVLNLPADYVANKLGVELTASTATINKNVEQAGLVQLVGTLQQHLVTGQQAAMILGNPNAPADVKEFTAKQFNAISKLITRVATTLDLRDADDLVATVGALNGIGEMAGRPIGGAVTGPGAGAPPVAAVPQLA